MRLDERKRPSCVKVVEVTSSLPFIRTGGKFWLSLREMIACFVLLWLNETRSSLPHLPINVHSVGRRVADMFLWSWISVYIARILPPVHKRDHKLKDNRQKREEYVKS